MNTKRQANKEDIKLNEELKLIVIAVYEKHLACRIYGTEILLNFKPSRLNIYPTTIHTVIPEKFWIFSKTSYVSGKIIKKELDFEAVDFEPLELDYRGPWDPEEDFYLEEGKPVEAWKKEILEMGEREAFEFEDVTPYSDPDSYEDDPVTLAIEARDYGDIDIARNILMDSLKKESRYIDAYVHLGNFCLSYNVKEALIYYSIGVNIGNLSLGEDFNEVLPWGMIDNRPYLRAYYNTGLCYWRLEDFEKALEIFRKILKLNPMDNQGARMIIPDIEKKISWKEYMSDEEYPDDMFSEESDMDMDFDEEFMDEDDENMEVFLQRRKVEWDPGPFKDKKLLEAQNLIWDAIETGDVDIYIENAKKAVKISSKCAEAWFFLAEYETTDIAKAVSYSEKALKAARRLIGTKKFHELKGYFFLYHYCVPYLKVLYTLSYLKYSLKQFHSSAELLEEMLELDIYDTLDARSMLMLVYLELGKYDKFKKLFDDEDNSGFSTQPYINAICEFIENGDCEKSREKLIEASKISKSILDSITLDSNYYILDEYHTLADLERNTDDGSSLLLAFLYEKEDVKNWLRKVKNEHINKLLKFPENDSNITDRIINRILANYNKTGKKKKLILSYDFLKCILTTSENSEINDPHNLTELILLNKNDEDICMFLLKKIRQSLNMDDTLGMTLLDIVKSHEFPQGVRNEAMDIFELGLEFEISSTHINKEKRNLSDEFIDKVRIILKKLYFDKTEDKHIRRASYVHSAALKEKWIKKEIKTLYNQETYWKIAALIAMKDFPEFKTEIIESLKNKNEMIMYCALMAACALQFEEALPYIEYKILNITNNLNMFFTLFIAVTQIGGIEKSVSYIKYFSKSPDPAIREYMKEFYDTIKYFE